MARMPNRSAVVLFALLAAFGLALTHVRAGSREATPQTSTVLKGFLEAPDPPVVTYHALRHLDARGIGTSAWMDVWTDVDARGFRYQVAAEDGSAYIRSHVFRAVLDAEQALWSYGAAERGAVTPDNYTFEPRGDSDEGLPSLFIRPRRKDVMLVDGAIYLDPADHDLVRLEGELSQSPSFWTRQVHIIRRYRRFAGVRLPVALDSAAHVLLAGRATFRMSYEYETVNGQRVGTPRLRAIR